MTQHETQMEQPTVGAHAMQSSTMDECIKMCLSCFQSCEQTILYCLSKGGHHASPQHISLLSACAEICQASAKFMMMRSPFHSSTCRVCAEVCEACARDCESMNDPEMNKCAQICRECADSCNKMAVQH